MKKMWCQKVSPVKRNTVLQSGLIFAILMFQLSLTLRRHCATILTVTVTSKTCAGRILPLLLESRVFEVLLTKHNSQSTLRRRLNLTRIKKLEQDHPVNNRSPTMLAGVAAEGYNVREIWKLVVHWCHNLIDSR